MVAPTLMINTTYAELLERCLAVAFDQDFPEEGGFISKTLKGRRYWYFQTNTPQGRIQRYAGPESPQLLARIERHRQARDDEKESRSLVATLTRSFGLASPPAPIGDVLAALTRAGVFRLRSVLVGTVAYQCYPALLGTKFPRPLLQTSDVDIAQFTNISVAVGEQTPAMIDVLRSVDARFRALPSLAGHSIASSYIGTGGLRVDFLTPNMGPETDKPARLPALNTDAQRLRFLDFLIHEPISAVVLHGAGIPVLIPTPERFAIHKLIIAQRRPAGVTKKDKDLAQAAALIDVLIRQRPEPLREAWQEAFGRGPQWRKLLQRALNDLPGAARDVLLKHLGETRRLVPDLELTFDTGAGRVDSERDIIEFAGKALGERVACAISREALEDHFGADGLNAAGRLAQFQANRQAIERLTRRKYLTAAIEFPQQILLRTQDVAPTKAARR